MHRRQFVGAAAVCLLVVPPVKSTEQSPAVRRIGLVRSGTVTVDERSTAAFLAAMRELGWADGQNLSIEYRWAEGRSERLPELVAELVRLRVDVIVVSSTPGAQAAVRATKAIPIVFGMVSDPVASGIVSSLARPGGNATGWSNTLPDSSGKLVELVKEVAPMASRVAVLWSPTNPGKRLEFEVVESAARRRGMTLQSTEVPTLHDLDAGLLALASSPPDALITFIDAVTSTGRRQIVEFATRQRLPAVYQAREFVTIGGLISYSPDTEQLWGRTAVFVDKILKGARPADLPVEQPTKFELVINMKTAKALGLTIPSTLLLRATDLIT
jgi:putative tryptophan/tyrosine transport system substrate-binding protein